MSKLEMTFTVRPRPMLDDPRAIADARPAQAATAIETSSAVVEDRREWDTFLGNLAFLVRYAFGRY